MTDFARKVLAGLPDTNLPPATTNNYTTLQEFTADSDKAGGKIDVQATPSAVAVRPLRLPQPQDVRPAEHPAAVRRRRQRRHLRAQPAVRARLDVDADGDVAARGAVRVFVDAGGEEPAGARHRQRARSVRAPGPADRPPHRGRAADAAHHRLLGSRTPGDQPAVAVPDGLQPEDQLHLDAGAHSFKSGYEFQRIDTEVQDVNPLYGRDTYNGSFTRPAGAAASNLYNLADFMLGLRAQYALSSVLVANLRRNMHFAYLQDDWRADEQADAESRAALRVLDAVLGSGQRPVELRSGDEHDRPREGRVDLRSRADQSRSQQLRAASRLRLHPRRRAR